MDEASSVDDDDDSIGGRCVERDVDDSERAAVRDLLVPLILPLMMMTSRPSYARIANAIISITSANERPSCDD